MKKMNVNFRKIAFLLCNFLFLLSGVGLVLLGCVLLNDYPRILLSRLFIEPEIISQPLLYYVALAFISAGLVVCAVAMLGCWASCYSDSNCLMGLYMILLIILLLAETSFVVVVALCPQVIGVVADRDQMVEGLMNNYGIPGRSQYTAAIDLAQTLLECCGMQSGSDYDGSKWWKREQETKHDLRVPHSCCFLMNSKYDSSFLDPKPINSSLCQAKTNSRYQYGRHVKGCVDKLNSWFRDHVNIFLTIGLALIAVQLLVFLCALLVCLRNRLPSSLNSSNMNLNVSKTSKQHGRSEKNHVPISETKTNAVQIQTVDDNNCFIVGKNHSTVLGVHKNFSNPDNYFSNKLNVNDDLEGVRGRDSPTSLPLVLRNDHFQRFDEGKPKPNTNSMKKNSIREKKCYRNQMNKEPNVYFTPRYEETNETDGFHNNFDIYKINGEPKSYFCPDENYGIETGMYESCKNT